MEGKHVEFISGVFCFPTCAQLGHSGPATVPGTVCVAAIVCHAHAHIITWDRVHKQIKSVCVQSACVCHCEFLPAH